MHRMITAVTVSALLAVSGCSGGGVFGSSAETVPPATTAAGSAPVVPKSRATAPSGSTRYTKSTEQVCASTNKIFVGKEMGRFADELGRMIGYKEAKLTPEVNRSRAAAAKHLTALAAQMRRQTATARDADVRAAGKEAASSIEASAKDPNFYAKVKSVPSLEKTLQTEMAPWITPVASVCA
jgi:hypothetical protein